MARSKAQKQRMKLVREGRRNPSENRSAYAFVDMVTRRTKTKKEYLNKRKSKDHFSSREEYDSFFIGQTIFSTQFLIERRLLVSKHPV